MLSISIKVFLSSLLNCISFSYTVSFYDCLILPLLFPNILLWSCFFFFPFIVKKYEEKCQQLSYGTLYIRLLHSIFLKWKNLPFFPPRFFGCPNNQTDIDVNRSKTNLTLLGSQNREKESRMAVAKRQGREKPAKIEQRKVPGGAQVEQTTFLAGPIYIGQAQGQEKANEKRSQRSRGLCTPCTLSVSFSLSCAHMFSLFLSLLFTCFESACLHASRMYFPLFSK